MAKNCCICEAKIGTFDKPAQMFQGDSRFLLCQTCEDNLRSARKSDIDLKSQSSVMYRNRAVNYFTDFLSRPNVDDRVAAELRSLPEVIDWKQQIEEAEAAKAENERRYREEKDSVLSTTGYSFDGYVITAYHGIVSTDNIIGTGIASEFKASVSDLMGESSKALKEKLASAKELAYQDLLKEAILAGGNAIIGISYDVYVFGSMLGVSVTGTSVSVIQKINGLQEVIAAKDARIEELESNEPPVVNDAWVRAAVEQLSDPQKAELYQAYLIDEGFDPNYEGFRSAGKLASCRLLHKHGLREYDVNPAAVQAIDADETLKEELAQAWENSRFAE